MPEKKFLLTMKEAVKSITPPKIVFTHDCKDGRWVSNAARYIKFSNRSVYKHDDEQDILNYNHDLIAYLKDTVIPIFHANLLNVSTEFIYSLSTPDSEKYVEESLSHLLNKDFSSFLRTVDPSSELYTYIGLHACVEGFEGDGLDSIYDPIHNCIIRRNIAVSKFYINIYLGDNSIIFYDLVKKSGEIRNQ